MRRRFTAHCCCHPARACRAQPVARVCYEGMAGVLIVGRSAGHGLPGHVLPDESCCHRSLKTNAIRSKAADVLEADARCLDRNEPTHCWHACCRRSVQRTGPMSLAAECFVDRGVQVERSICSMRTLCISTAARVFRLMLLTWRHELDAPCWPLQLRSALRFDGVIALLAILLLSSKIDSKAKSCNPYLKCAV